MAAVRRLFVGFFLSVSSCFGAGAVAPEGAHLEQFVLPDGSTQLSWTTETPRRSATVAVTDASGRKTLVKEKTDKVRNHAVVIPAAKAKGASVLVTADGKEENALFSPLKLLPAPAVKTQAFTVPLQVADPAAPRKAWPVRSGVPFAKGVLGSAKDVMLTDASGNEMPCTFEVFSKWPDGSVKWLIVNFNADTAPGESLKVCLKERKEGKAKAADLKPDAQKKLLSDLRCEITFADGTVATGRLSREGIVSQTPIPGGTRLRFRSDFEGKPEYVLEAVCTLASNGLVSVDFRIVTLRSRKVEEVRSILWKGFPKFGGADFAARQFYAEPPRQDGFFQAPGLAVYVPDFWQQYPKGAVAKDGEFVYEMLPVLSADYLPAKPSSQQVFCRYFWFREGGLYGFRNHMSLPGAFSILTGKAAETPGELLKKQFETPLFAAATPEYYCGTEAFGPVFPADGKTFPQVEQYFRRNFAKNLKTRETVSDYGWMSYGDWFGERRDNWGNNEYDLAYLMGIQFARTGKFAYLKRGVEMARHYTSVDVHHTDKPARKPELVYPHKIGHTGELLDPKGHLASFTEHYKGTFVGSFDNRGGHDFLAGSFFMAALTGDPLVRDAAEYACLQQAIYMSIKVDITIERTAGWNLVNQTNAYLFTGNPLHLNAARFVVDEVIARQNPKTGCLDLPTDLKECDCPDKKEHRGGKGFAMGVLMHGMRFYHGITGEKRAADSIVRSADWIMNECYDPETGMLRYKTGCPKYARGTKFTPIVSEGVAYAGVLTGNRKYAEFIRDHVDLRGYNTSAGSSSKGFAMDWRLIPHALRFMQMQGITAFPERPVQVNKTAK